MPTPNLTDEANKPVDAGIEETLSKKTHEEALKKAREDEKSKVYPDLEKARKLAADTATEAELLRKSKAELEAKIAELTKPANTDPSAELTSRLAALEAENKSAKEGLESAKREASEALSKHKLELYRAKRLHEANITAKAASFVTGGNEQEIEASIASIKELEAELSKKQAVTDKEEERANVPRTVKTPGYSNSNDTAVLALKDRQAAVKLPKKDYAAWRTKQLQALANAR